MQLRIEQLHLHGPLFTDHVKFTFQVPRGSIRPGIRYAGRLSFLRSDSETTAAAIDAARWMHSGDLAVMREDGRVNIVGRLKDMNIRGGENIYPREIEEFLHTHPKVNDVQVSGVPDKKYGEEVCAWIRLRPGHIVTEDEIRDFCRGQIATFKIPRHIRFVTEFPMTVTGKIQKFRMREQMLSELGLSVEQTA
jgi:fatty-acyl-CoA synthase